MAKNVTYLVSEAFTTIVEVNWSVNKLWHEWPPTLRDCVISFPLSWQRNLAPFCSSLRQFSHNHSKRCMLLLVSFPSADSLSIQPVMLYYSRERPQWYRYEKWSNIPNIPSPYGTPVEWKNHFKGRIFILGRSDWFSFDLTESSEILVEWNPGL